MVGRTSVSSGLPSVAAIERAVTSRTKVVMPVDIGGWPCDYDAIAALVKKRAPVFVPRTDVQRALGRILVLSDAAHSVGAVYKKRKIGGITDVTVFSFHAVKNLTTAEGGAVALNLPAPFDNEELYRQLCVKTLHGQNKDALAKMQKANWRYDIVEAGYKCNMTDIAAAIGLVELERYDEDTLVKRRRVFEQYTAAFSKHAWAQLPVYERDGSHSSYHLYPLRIKGVTEAQRDAIIQGIFDRDVSVNVHFIPVPMMSFYRALGYDVHDTPVAYDNYAREISLPVYYTLSDAQVQEVIDAVVAAVKDVTAVDLVH